MKISKATMMLQGNSSKKFETNTVITQGDGLAARIFDTALEGVIK